MIKTDNRYQNAVLSVGIFLSFFAIPHLIDDFLFGIPAEFGMTNQFAQFLSGLFTVMLIWVLVWVSKGRKIGFISSIFLGSFLALAGIIKHIPKIIQPGPYWSGWFSELLILGLIVTGIVLAGVSTLAVIRSS
jgi:hypothetical protein